MLRPATPLAVMLFAAFVLLLLSVLSTPLIKGIPLGSFQGFNFGVFGFCKPDGSCSGFELGYDTSTLFSPDDSATFDLPTATRTTLSTILVLHPIAALLTLIMLILAFSAHFHSASHSVRYLLLVFIISIFTFLAALLAFLIDVLLFVPHMAWGSFIVLAAVILIGLSSIISCAMRRTLVSRKSRQRRIAANAEMSGENFYNRQAQTAAPVSATGASSVMAEPQLPIPRQPTLPSIGGPGSTATYEKKDDASSDEQIPLTSQAQQISNRYSQQPLSRNQFGSASPADAMMMSGAVGGAMTPQRPNRPPSVQRDAYGNPLPYGGAVSPPPPDGGYGMRRGPSFEQMNNTGPPQRGRGGGPGYRGGRVGGPSPGPYGPPGRGGYGPPPPGGRGGYVPRGRGSPYGGRGGYPGPGRGPPPGYRYDQPGPYGGMQGPSPGPQGGPGSYYGNVSRSSLDGGMGGDGYDSYRHERMGSVDLPRAESPPPLPSQVAEIDGAAIPHARQPQQVGRFSEADDDIAGMVGLQQGRTSGTIPEHPGNSESGQYVPPRTNWNSNNNPPVRGAVELGITDAEPRPTTSEAYIEDVDPRFADSQNNANRNSNNNNLHPPSQMPQPHQNLVPLAMNPNQPYDEVPQGSRSPAESERSNFTSISQRGINPRWNPPPPTLMPGYGSGGLGPPGSMMVPRRAIRDPNETLLNSNPDFSLPTGSRRPSGGPGAANLGGAGGGLIPGSAYPAM